MKAVVYAFCQSVALIDYYARARSLACIRLISQFGDGCRLTSQPVSHMDDRLTGWLAHHAVSSDMREIR